MKTIRHIFIVTALNFKNLPSRMWPSLVIIVGMACVIGVLLSMLSLSTGLFQAYADTGNAARRVLITSKGSQSETPSNIPREALAIIRDAPGIEKDSDGSPMADPALYTNIPAIRKDTGLNANVALRGFGPKGIALRPEIKLVAGRMYQPGKREFIVGVGAIKQFQGLELGKMVSLPDGDWPIVGVFDAGGSTLSGNLVTEVEAGLTAARRNYFSGVYLRLDEAPDSFNKLKTALTANPALSVQVERHSDYYLRMNSNNSIYRIIAYAVGIIMAVGAVFGALNTMYAAVSTRTREIATLRALGFGALPVAISVVAEAVFLALTGAAIGAGIAWLLYDGVEHTIGTSVFQLTVSSASIAIAIIWAMSIALIGGLFPSVRAARLPIATGLRAQ